MSNVMTKVIAFSATKGGVGKTTLAFNFGAYLAKTSNKVLLIDLDHQASMSSNFSLNDEELEKTDIGKVFKSVAKDPSSKLPTVEPVEVTDNLFGLSISQSTDNIDSLMRDLPYACTTVYRLLKDNQLLDRFDYIVCDTHPDLLLATQNALTMANVVFSPVEPSRYGLDSVISMQNDYEKLSNRILSPDGSRLIDGKLAFIANKVKFNTTISHLFMDSIKDDERFVSLFHERELFNQATLDKKSVFDLNNPKVEKIVTNEISPQFELMKKYVISGRVDK